MAWQGQVTEAGMQQGIGDYRPEKRGPFGTFRVTGWELNAVEEAESRAALSLVDTNSTEEVE